MLSILCLMLAIASIAHAACPPFDTNVTLPSSLYPPDPFTFFFGSKVTTKADWECRRAELLSVLQENALGTLPPKPTNLTAALSDNELTINVTTNGKKASFSATVSVPSNPNDDSTRPAVIHYGSATIPTNDTSITTITYNPDQIASNTVRGRGLFYDLHGSSHTAGAFIAWTWGISLVIDALELLPPHTTRIDPRRIGIAGCSRYGKAVLVAGAFEPRIALTVAQEGGVGGPSCWRLYRELQCKTACIPEQKDPWEGTPWFRSSFPLRRGYRFEDLPFDQHELITLHAPRALLVLENSIDWLQPVGTTVCGMAGRAAYEALGVKENYGFVLRGVHAHCGVPESQEDIISRYVQGYLVGGGGGGGGAFESDFKEQASRYGPDWTVPILS